MDLQDCLVAGKFIHQFLSLFQEVVSRHTALLPVKPWTNCLCGISIGEFRLLLLEQYIIIVISMNQRSRINHGYFVCTIHLKIFVIKRERPCTTLTSIACMHFCKINFCSCYQLQKYENFQIYGIRYSIPGVELQLCPCQM